MKFNSGVKYLPASRLCELLSQLPPDTRVTPNGVGNLALLNVDVFIGYIDLMGEGSLELNEE